VTYGAGWHSWHVHAGSLAPDALDRLLVGAVAPVIDASGASRWFFVRYWQRGPHLRLRVADLDSAAADAIEADLVDATAAIDRGRIGDDAYERSAAMIAAAGETSGPVDAGRVRAAGVYCSRYLPEFDRYGGAGLMSVSEQLFCSSSRLALACARRGAEANSAGLAALAVTCGALPWPADGFLTTIQRLWTQWLGRGGADPTRIERAAGSAAARLGESAAPLLDALDGRPSQAWAPWTADLNAAVRAWADVLDEQRMRAVAGSHVHMLLNRLGVGAGGDAYLAAVLLELARNARTRTPMPR
jgi:thiopeptide-type bacteriocin biosynthesis protein